jgi:ribonuclease I
MCAITSCNVYAYAPEDCTITNYMFTFIWDNKNESFKVHGLWPEQCTECITCGYPSCCNAYDIIYTDPYDPTNFIQNYWYNTTTSEECTGLKSVSLFEHEYYKHISCTDMTTTTEFLNQTIELYDRYYDNYVKGKCESYHELWLNLDDKYKYLYTKCS